MIDYSKLTTNDLKNAVFGKKVKIELLWIDEECETGLIIYEAKTLETRLADMLFDGSIFNPLDNLVMLQPADQHGTCTCNQSARDTWQSEIKTCEHLAAVLLARRQGVEEYAPHYPDTYEEIKEKTDQFLGWFKERKDEALMRSIKAAPSEAAIKHKWLRPPDTAEKYLKYNKVRWNNRDWQMSEEGQKDRSDKMLPYRVIGGDC